jgi:hypothetical protein
MFLVVIKMTEFYGQGNATQTLYAGVSVLALITLCNKHE